MVEMGLHVVFTSSERKSYVVLGNMWDGVHNVNVF